MTTDLLATLPAFAGCTARDLAVIDRLLQPLDVEAGTRVLGPR
jgi:hypothetical protein